MTDKMREAIIKILNGYTQEMENYSYYGSNRGVSVDDYKDIADEIIAWQAAQSVPVVGEVVDYQFFDDGKWHNFIDDRHYQNTVAAGYEVRALVVQPTHSISAAELERLRKCKALLGESREAMRQYEADCDEYPPFHHNNLMKRIDAAIAAEGEK